MGKIIEFESGARHFFCDGCSTIKPIEKGAYRTPVAYSRNNGNHVLTSKLLCEKCYYGDEEKDEEKKM